MSLNSFAFILFLPIVVWINFLIPRKYRYIWLAAASLFFYLSNDIRYAFSLAFCTLTTYGAALLLARSTFRKRRTVLFICIFVNILQLFLFRHTFLNSLFVPLGISFYTLQAIGYLVDVYRGEIAAERNPLCYGLFLAFFPTVASGPIQRGTGLLRQIQEGRDFDYAKARSGLYYLLWGYLMKLVIANRLGSMVGFAYDRSNQMPGATLAWASILYGVQLYCDFAGYSALAIGAGRLLGFDIGENFYQPYFSVSIREFWNRWHIGLSSWLRDYIYIPLGGSRKGTLRRYLNLFITFLVSGLWHGSGINFLVWGALHGGYQVAGCGIRDLKEKYFYKYIKKTDSDKISERSFSREKLLSGGARIFGCIITFLLVDFAWIFFRADSLAQAEEIIYRIFCCFHLKEMTYYGSYLLGRTRLELLLMLVGIGLVFLVDLLHEKKISLEAVGQKRNIAVRWGIYLVLTLLLLFVLVRDYGQAASTFIYERF